MAKITVPASKVTHNVIEDFAHISHIVSLVMVLRDIVKCKDCGTDILCTRDDCTSCGLASPYK